MRLEINTQLGVENHILNDYQSKKFKEWLGNPNSINVFTYLRNGYTWSIIKQQVINIKYIEN